MIRWPESHEPARTHVHVRNEIDVAAPPEQVWAWLVRAPMWPTWYPNSKSVKVQGDAPGLAPGRAFRWKTFGVSLRSKVEEWVPPERLGWNARAIGVDAYHAWLIEPRPVGCHVLTEETQNGALARLAHAVRPGRMRAGHQLWLERLRIQAMRGPPPVTE